MKLKGIWIAIAVICIAGIGITDCSVSHFSSEESVYVSETQAETYLSAADEVNVFETQAGPADQKEDGKRARVQKNVQTDETGSENENGSEKKQGIKKELAELDEQVQTMQNLSVSKSVNAMKAEAETERKIWESKLQDMLEILEKQLPEQEKDALFSEQRNWIHDRENTAAANSKRQNGSALEELEYIRSLRDLTRERVYRLAERYESVLNEWK